MYATWLPTSLASAFQRADIPSAIIDEKWNSISNSLRHTHTQAVSILSTAYPHLHRPTSSPEAFRRTDPTTWDTNNY